MSDYECIISMTLSRRILVVVGRVESNYFMRFCCANPLATDASFGHRQLRSVFHTDASWQRPFSTAVDVASM